MTDLIGFTLVNEATKTAVLYTGVSANLDLVLVNNTAAPIGVLGGASPSTLTFYLPDGLFTADQLAHLGVSVPGWTPMIDTGAATLTLTSNAASSWAAGATLTFPVGNTMTTASPAPGFLVSVEPQNLTGNVPSQVNAPLLVTLPPDPGRNLDLPDFLQLSLDNQGLVYCSDAANVLTSQLFLTLKNIGESALATGPTLAGNPQVVVSFVYGATGGALAPDTADARSAWSITGTVKAQPPKAAWTPPGGPVTRKKPPRWLFTPSEGNTTILGGVRTDSANVTFVFDQVVPNKVPGHTQMLVLCTGFRKDATTAYDDHLYVLDINKQAPPPTFGVLAFAADQPVVEVSDPRARVRIHLDWTTFGAASVSVLTSSAAVGYVNVPSPVGSGLLAYSGTDVDIDPPETNQALFLTAQALDTAGNYLGGAQYTTFLRLSYVQDPNGWVYPTALFKDHYWMLRDYAYSTTGSYVYGDLPNPPPGTTRLYTPATAADAAPPGWRLPTAAVWQELIDSYRTDPYAALIVGGTSPFAANLTGFRLGGSYRDIERAGYYWSSSSSGPLTQFSSGTSTVTADVPWKSDVEVEFAVRYVCPA